MNRLVTMIIIAVLILGIGGYFIFKGDKPTTKSPLKEGPIVAFGDSLVKGYGSGDGDGFVEILSERIKKPIINAGNNGDTTEKGIARLDEALSKKPSLVILLLGGNDFLQRVPRDQTFANLGIIIDKLEADGIKVLLLGVRGGVLSDAYEERFEDLAEEKEVVFVPDVLDGILGNPDLTSDSVHPNAAGYRMIADKVEPTLRKILE